MVKYVKFNFVYLVVLFGIWHIYTFFYFIGHITHNFDIPIVILFLHTFFSIKII